MEDITTEQIVQYQSDYKLQSNIINIKRVQIVKGNSIYDLEPLSLDEDAQGRTKTTANPPESYVLWGDYIRLSDRPSIAASATTLSGALTSNGTSVSVASASFLPRHGRLRIEGQEIVEYWHWSGTTLTAVSRGMENFGVRSATQSNFADAGTVKLQDLWVYHTKRDKALSSDSDEPNIPNQFRPALAYKAAGDARMKSKDMQEATGLLQVYTDYVQKGLDYTKGRWKHRVNVTK